jgi:hypothetical protein
MPVLGTRSRTLALVNSEDAAAALRDMGGSGIPLEGPCGVAGRGIGGECDSEGHGHGRLGVPTTDANLVDCGPVNRLCPTCSRALVEHHIASGGVPMGHATEWLEEAVEDPLLCLAPPKAIDGPPVASRMDTWTWWSRASGPVVGYNPWPQLVGAPRHGTQCTGAGAHAHRTQHPRHSSIPKQ